MLNTWTKAVNVTKGVGDTKQCTIPMELARLLKNTAPTKLRDVLRGTFSLTV